MISVSVIQGHTILPEEVISDPSLSVNAGAEGLAVLGRVGPLCGDSGEDRGPIFADVELLLLSSVSDGDTVLIACRFLRLRITTFVLVTKIALPGTAVEEKNKNLYFLYFPPSRHNNMLELVTSWP